MNFFFPVEDCSYDHILPLLQAKHTEYSVNLAPHPKAVTRAFRDLILAYGWRSVFVMIPLL